MAVVVGSLVVAAAGSLVLFTRHVDEGVTTAGITATLPVPGHPGWMAADAGTVWLAQTGDPRAAATDQPLMRIDPATGAVLQTVPAGGQATFVTRVGGRLIASVQHVGDDPFQPRRLLALDWLTGRVLLRRGFGGPVDHVVSTGNDLWALQVRPAALLHLDPATLAPTAAPVPLARGRALDIAAGAGALWVTAVDDGAVIRIDPASGALQRVDVGGAPTGIAVAGDSVWIADPERGRILRRDAVTLRSVGEGIAVGGRPTWIAATPRYVFVTDGADGTVSRVDVASGRLAGPRIRVAPDARAATSAIAPAGPVVWVSSFAANTLTRISADPAATPSAATTAAAGAGTVATPVLPRGAVLVARIDVSAGPGEFAVGEGAVWAGNFDDGKLARIDPASNRVVGQVEIPPGPGEAAAGAGAVWVSNTRAGTVARIDPRTAKRVASVRVGPQPGGLAVGSGAVWVANGGGPTVSRIDPATNRVVATIRIGPKSACCSEHIAITAHDGAVWAAVPNMDAVVHIDPRDNSIAATVKVSGSPCAGIAVDAESVWSAGGACGDFLTRVDPRTGRVGPARVEVAHPIGVELFAGAVWVAALGSKTVDRLDPLTGRIVGRLPIGGLPIRTGLGFGSLWVRDDSGRVLRIRPLG